MAGLTDKEVAQALSQLCFEDDLGRAWVDQDLYKALCLRIRAKNRLTEVPPNDAPVLPKKPGKTSFKRRSKRPSGSRD